MTSHLPSRLQPWLAAAADLLFPPRCAACRARLPGGNAGLHASVDDGYCSGCRDTLIRVTPPQCSVCSEPFPAAGGPDLVCPNCHGETFAFDFAASAWLARGALREAIHRFKYERCLGLRKPLAACLADALTDPRIRAETGWLLVPVPLHQRRFREREFNQSAELANQLARRSGLPLADVLRRTRYTTTQASLGREARKKNLRGAFALHPRALRRHPITGRNILLVDDVFTTGSTADECARVLRKKGQAARVVVITVARG